MLFLNLGLLDQPQNISIVSNSRSLIHFKWSPPFSLEITEPELEHQEAIQYYEVSITDKASNEVILNTTEDTEYVYELKNPQNHCHRIEFKVAAINEVGRGNQSGGIVTGFIGCKFHYSYMISLRVILHTLQLSSGSQR